MHDQPLRTAPLHDLGWEESWGLGERVDRAAVACYSTVQSTDFLVHPASQAHICGLLLSEKSAYIQEKWACLEASLQSH